MKKISILISSMFLILSSCDLIPNNKLEGSHFYAATFNTNDISKGYIKFTSRQVVEMEVFFSKDSVFFKTKNIYANSAMNDSWTKKNVQKGCVNIAYAYTYSNDKITIPEMSATPTKVIFFDNHIMMDDSNMLFYKKSIETLNESEKMDRIKKLTYLNDDDIKSLKYSFKCQ